MASAPQRPRSAPAHNLSVHRRRATEIKSRSKSPSDTKTEDIVPNIGTLRPAGAARTTSAINRTNTYLIALGHLPRGEGRS